MNEGVQGWVGVGVVESRCKRDREERRRRRGETLPRESRSRHSFCDLHSLFKMQTKLHPPSPSQDCFPEL